VISRTMEMHDFVSAPGLVDILAADRWARKAAAEIIQGLIR